MPQDRIERLNVALPTILLIPSNKLRAPFQLQPMPSIKFLIFGLSSRPERQNPEFPSVKYVSHTP
jgi:hypothetical protein